MRSARGEQGARRFDRRFFTLPIPRFDPAEPLHQEFAAEAERLAAVGPAFTAIRSALPEAGVWPRLALLAVRPLDGAPEARPAPEPAQG